MCKKLNVFIIHTADILDDFIQSPLFGFFIVICIYAVSAIVQWDKIVSVYVYYLDCDIFNSTIKDAICVVWNTVWSTVKLFLIPTIVASVWIVFHSVFND